MNTDKNTPPSSSASAPSDSPAPKPETASANSPPKASETARGFRGSGGTRGGVGLFLFGAALAGTSLWLFLDSVRVATEGHGWISGLLLAGRHGGGGVSTTSMGVVFLPFFCGVFALFYDARMKWAWWLASLGVGVIVVEILSRLQFFLSMKTSHLLLMIATFAAGTAMMVRSYRDLPPDDADAS